jgi:chromosome segregation ATPase
MIKKGEFKMRNKSFYTLLCTTILFSGFTLAMEGDAEPATPIRNATAEKEKVDREAPGTVQLKSKIRTQYDQMPYNERDKERFAAVGTDAARVERDAEKARKKAIIDAAAAVEMAKRDQEKLQKSATEERARHEELLKAAKAPQHELEAQKANLMEQLKTLEQEKAEAKKEFDRQKEQLERETAEAKRNEALSTEVGDKAFEMLEQLTEKYRKTSDALTIKEREARQALEALERKKAEAEKERAAKEFLETQLRDQAQARAQTSVPTAQPIVAPVQPQHVPAPTPVAEQQGQGAAGTATVEAEEDDEEGLDNTAL